LPNSDGSIARPYRIHCNNAQFSTFNIVPDFVETDRRRGYKSFDDVNEEYFNFWKRAVPQIEPRFEEPSRVEGVAVEYDSLTRVEGNEEFDNQRQYIRNINFIDFDVWEAYTRPPLREEELGTDDDDDDDDDKDEDNDNDEDNRNDKDKSVNGKEDAKSNEDESPNSRCRKCPKINCSKHEISDDEVEYLPDKGTKNPVFFWSPEYRREENNSKSKSSSSMRHSSKSKSRSKSRSESRSSSKSKSRSKSRSKTKSRSRSRSRSRKRRRDSPYHHRSHSNHNRGQYRSRNKAHYYRSNQPKHYNNRHVNWPARSSPRPRRFRRESSTASLEELDNKCVIAYLIERGNAHQYQSYVYIVNNGMEPFYHDLSCRFVQFPQDHRILKKKEAISMGYRPHSACKCG